MERTFAPVVAFALLILSAPWSTAVSLVVDQGPHDAALQARNSNTPTNSGSDQQVADDFTITGAGLEITMIEFWFTYRDTIIDQLDAVAPVLQDMVVQIFADDGAGNPGVEVYQTNVSLTPTSTGDRNGFQTPNEIFFGAADLVVPFAPEAGERYWLSPRGDDDSVTWQWQLSDPDGERRSRGGAAGPDWRGTALDNVTPLDGDFAFRLYAIPEPAVWVTVGLASLCGLRRSRRGCA